ncbi:hypothetical protein DPMN_128449 [Dreissena polymorpha]|uniref:Uncharacterized protein n=1 Tax=Dreissena polymorpha TaxID=45954 RepID=A0A9D4H347_DREPO|nr:hypothetical protein DPMN_128449 [Dreissena polymorpha]
MKAVLYFADDAEDVVKSLGGDEGVPYECWRATIETDYFVEDSYDYDNDADYISSEESDSDCKGTVYPERDTVNIYVEWKSTRLQIWMSLVGILLLA